MSDVVFVETRHSYDSYTDVRSLIRLSGFPVCYVDEVDAYDGRTYICITRNGEWPEGGWSGATSRIIHWSLEWAEYAPLPGVEETWVSDKWWAQRTNARFVPLGSHPGLADNSGHDLPKQYDLAMLAYMGPPRRQQVANDCLAKGLTLAPNGWAEERHRILRQTRMVAHVHQHEGVHTVAPSRFALAAAYWLPVLTETLADAGIFAGHVMMSDQAHYADLAKLWIGSEARLGDFGYALHHLLCVEHGFRKVVDAAV